MTLNEMTIKLEKLREAFTNSGGRGVELAEEIDRLQAEIDAREHFSGKNKQDLDDSTYEGEINV